MGYRRLLMSAVTILIPCVLGIVGMIHGGISVGIWVENLIFIVAFALAACVVMWLGVRIPDRVAIVASALLIGLTFLEPDIDGVHRWLYLPGFTLNAAAVVMPACVVALTRLADERQTAWCACGIASIGLLVYMQPDASQLLAFALPILVLFISADFHRYLKWFASGILALLPLLSWLRLDTLAPVSYTEGILTLLREQSVLLYIAGILSLFLVPAGMMMWGFRERQKTWTGVGLYYALMILSTFYGSFPVPFMGYGASPILGYYIMILFIQEKW